MVHQEGGNRLVFRQQASANSVRLEHMLPRENGASFRKNGREKLRWFPLKLVAFSFLSVMELYFIKYNKNKLPEKKLKTNRACKIQAQNLH